MIITASTDANTVSITEKVGTVAVAGIDQDTKTITATGNITGFVDPGSKINIVGSTGNDRAKINVGYTVVSVEFTGGNTEMVVEEDIPDDTVDGDVEYYLGLNKATNTITVDGNITADIAVDDIVEIVNAKEPENNFSFKVDGDTYVAGNDTTEIVVEEDIPSVKSPFGDFLYFNGNLANFFMLKSSGTEVYNIIPTGGNPVRKVDEETIAVGGNHREFVFKFADLRLPVAANIDAAITAIAALIN